MYVDLKTSKVRPGSPCCRWRDTVATVLAAPVDYWLGDNETLEQQ